ncbi:MAG: EAL domain-containing protein [Phycisphaerales bacterium JB060]
MSPRPPGILHWRSLPTLAFAAAGVALLAVSATRMARYIDGSETNTEHGAARQTLLQTGESLTEDVERVVEPAMRRGRIIARSPHVVAALRNDDTDELTRLCNAAVRNATEIDAVAIFNNAGEILTINTVYSSGESIAQERVDRILSNDYTDRDIIMNCIENDAKTEVLEFQTTCDITPAFFDSSGLSIAHSVPIHGPDGEQVGLVSTRLRFERITSLIDGYDIAGGEGSVWFVTDFGGFFNEDLNAGALPPMPMEELASFTQSLIRRDVDQISFDRGETTYMLFRMEGLNTMAEGGIQAMIATPLDWLNREARHAALIAVGTPGVFGLMFLLLAQLHRSYLKSRAQFAVSQWRLLQSHQLVEIIERSCDATIIADEDGRIRYANAAARTLGEEVCCPSEPGERAVLYNSDCVDAGVTTQLQQTLATGDRMNIRVRLTPCDGGVSGPGGSIARSARWVEASASLLPFDKHSGRQVVLVMRDITDKVGREARERLRARGAELCYEISGILSGDAPFATRIEHAIGATFGFEQLRSNSIGGVYLLDPSESELRLLTLVGAAPETPGFEPTRPVVEACPYSQVARGGRASLCQDAAGAGHRYIIPLADDADVLGVLFLGTGMDTIPDAPMLDVLATIGTLIARAVIRHDHEQRLSDTNTNLLAAHQRYELAIAGSRDAIFDWDPASGRVFYSERWAELLEREGNDLTPSISTLLEHVASSDVHRVEQELFGYVQQGQGFLESEFRLMTSDGRVVWALLRATASREASGVASRISGSVTDISTLKTVEEEMRRLVQQDQLTGLASRNKLLENLEHAITRAKRSGTHAAVLFFDFDRFKVVNDSLGHDAGDELLCSIAARLRAQLRKADTAARFGGDEFVILLEDLPDTQAARRIADHLLTVCAEPHEIRGRQIVSTASIGVVTTELSSSSPASMLRDADAAMYQAKSTGRGRVVEFDKAMLEATLERLALEEELRKAISANELSLHYQPIVDLESGEPIGAEALARWHHETRGTIQPDAFIPIAEESNQITDLGDLVLHEACRQLVDWKRRKVVRDDFTLSVNLSKLQLTVPGFVDYLNELVASAGLRPKDIKLEVTETTIVDNRAGIERVLHELRESGFVIMMDDFGTGHSSLSGLHALPIDELKIDQSFIRHENVSKELIAITSSIVTLAGNLSLRTVGEGIESLEHISLLQSLGCNSGQGFFFSKPLPAGLFEAWLLTRSRDQAA